MVWIHYIESYTEDNLDDDGSKKLSLKRISVGCTKEVQIAKSVMLNRCKGKAR